MAGRLNRIDEIRGITLISMILYHFCWDLKFLAGFEMEWYVSPVGAVWQKSICITFILISGFCFSMGHKRLKRSLIIFGCGLVITAVTLIFMPQNRVVFGILTFIGAAGLLTIPVNKLVVRDKKADKVKKQIKDLSESDPAAESKNKALKKYICLLSICLVLFIIFFTVNKRYLNLIFTTVPVPDFLCHGYFNTFLGFTDPTFFSTDYFALLPWYFLYLCGYFLYGIYCEYADKFSGFLSKSTSKFLSFFGRHSLIIYMVHQPVAAIIVVIIIFMRQA